MRKITKYIKGSSKKGAELISKGSNWDGNTLHQVYEHYSYEKEKHYNECYNTYLSMDNHSAFSIVSHNTYSFNVSWVATIDNEDVLIFCTSSNTYCVWLDR